MQEVRIGEFIQKERIRQGITQEELCDGICSAVTLSRLENGGSNPSLSLVNALLQRLKLDGGRFYARLTPQEQQVEDLTKEIISCNVRYQHALEAERPAIRAEGYGHIHALEQAMDKDDHLTAQFILRSRVILGGENNIPYTLEEELVLLSKAMRITIPKFTMEDLGKYRYTVEEIKILNQIASRYFNSGRQEEALAIYESLTTYLHKAEGGNTDIAKQICLITNNYSADLCLCKHYQKAAEVAEVGRSACLKFGHFQLLGGLTHTLAECYHFMGNDEVSIELFSQAYNFYCFVKDQDGVERVRSDVNAYFPALKKIIYSVIGGIFG